MFFYVAIDCYSMCFLRPDPVWINIHSIVLLESRIQRTKLFQRILSLVLFLLNKYYFKVTISIASILNNPSIKKLKVTVMFAPFFRREIVKITRFKAGGNWGLIVDLQTSDLRLCNYFRSHLCQLLTSRRQVKS